MTDPEQPSSEAQSGAGYWAASPAAAYPTRAQPSAAEPSAAQPSAAEPSAAKQGAPVPTGTTSAAGPARSRRRVLHTWPVAAAILIGAAAVTTAVVVTSGDGGSAPAGPATQSPAPQALSATDQRYVALVRGTDRADALAGDTDAELVTLGRAACRNFDVGAEARVVLTDASRAGLGTAADDLVGAAVGTYCSQYRYLLG